MSETRPCLCRPGYRCHLHVVADRNLAKLANHPADQVTDVHWCRLMYLHEQDDLDLLLFEGEAS